MKRRRAGYLPSDDSGDYRVRDGRRAFGQYVVLESLMGEYLGEPYPLPYANDTSFEPFFARMTDVRTQRYECYKVFLQYIDNWRQAYVGAFWFGLGETTETDADADKFIAKGFADIQFCVDREEKAICAGEALVYIAHLDDRPERKLRPGTVDTFLYDMRSPTDERARACQQPISESDHQFVAKTPRTTTSKTRPCVWLRYILTKCKTPEEVVDSFDFRFLQCGYVGSEDRVIIRDRRALCLIESGVVHWNTNTDRRVSRYRGMGATILCPFNPVRSHYDGRESPFVQDCPDLKCSRTCASICDKGHPVRCCKRVSVPSDDCVGTYGGGCLCTNGLCAYHYSLEGNCAQLKRDHQLTSISATGNGMRCAWKNFIRQRFVELGIGNVHFRDYNPSDKVNWSVFACLFQFPPSRSETKTVTRLSIKVSHLHLLYDPPTVIEHQLHPEQDTYCAVVLNDNKRFVSFDCDSPLASATTCRFGN